MEIVGFIILVVIIIVIAAALVLWGSGRTRRNPPQTPPPDPWWFSIDPQVICADANCTATVTAGVTTDQPSASGRVTVLMPDNQTKVLAEGLSIDRGLAGDDPFFDAGLGQHVVTFEATGLRQGTVRGTSDIYLIDDGYLFGHSVRHRFPINSPEAERLQHVDVFTMGDVQGQKATRIVSICKDISLVEVRCLSVDPPPGHPKDLAVQVFDAAGALVAGATLTEGSRMDVPPGVVRGTGAVVSTLPSGAGGVFPPDASVSWTLQLRFACD